MCPRIAILILHTYMQATADEDPKLAQIMCALRMLLSKHTASTTGEHTPAGSTEDRAGIARS